MIGTQTVDIGEWSDDHPLNQVGADTSALFTPSPPTDREAFEEVYAIVHPDISLDRFAEDYESTRTNEAWYAFQLNLAAIRQAARTGGGE